MAADERKRWLIVATLFVTNFLVLGSSWNTIGAFTIPLLKEFGWTHAKVASLWTVFGLFSGISPLLAGFLLDWIEARIVICAGIAMTGTAFVLVSRSHAYPYLMAAYLLMGVGMGAATLVPAALVITNWFRERRGFPLGIVMAGTTVGGMILQSLSGYLIVVLGWRTTYRIYSLPLFLLMPLVWALVRSYPPGDPGFSARRAGPTLAVPGLEVGDALRTRSFWLISLIQFDSGFVVGGAFVPAISYLTHIGYGYIYATLAASMVMGSGAIGKLLMGVIADRIGVRQTFVLNALLLALGIAALLGAHAGMFLVFYVVVYGLTFVASLTLIPMIVAESLGRKCFGTLSGLFSLPLTIGLSISPAITGRIFDLTGSYTMAFTLCVVLALLTIPAALGCRPLGERPAVPAFARVRAAGISD